MWRHDYYIYTRVLLFTLLFKITVNSRPHGQKHLKKKPNFRAVVPSILDDVDDFDELKGTIEQPLVAEEKAEPEEKNNEPLKDYNLKEPTGIDFDKPLEEHEMQKPLQPTEVIQNLSNTFGHKYLECEALVRN